MTTETFTVIYFSPHHGGWDFAAAGKPRGYLSTIGFADEEIAECETSGRFTHEYYGVIRVLLCEPVTSSGTLPSSAELVSDAAARGQREIPLHGFTKSEIAEALTALASQGYDFCFEQDADGARLTLHRLPA